jgi:hypothetical protein
MNSLGMTTPPLTHAISMNFFDATVNYPSKPLSFSSSCLFSCLNKSLIFIPHATEAKLLKLFKAVIYNIYNNYIINNKSDEIKILKIRMAARHSQWRHCTLKIYIYAHKTCLRRRARE